MSPLSTFTPLLSSQKEASLIIIDSPDGVHAVQSELLNKGFADISQYEDLGKPGQRMLRVLPEHIKDAYDVVAQYPTGQIRLFDMESGTRWVNPIYEKSAFLVLIDKETLKSADTKGMSFRNACGLTLQV